ncbi:hypothetical protein BGZ47_007997 [Haplosporangium gracile]|nr:hypothetical protein BGZ47_007997 [Haplosporangium gracile]
MGTLSANVYGAWHVKPRKVVQTSSAAGDDTHGEAGSTEDATLEERTAVAKEVTDTTVDEDAGKSDKQVNFVACFLRYLHSGRVLTGRGDGALVIEFIERLKQLSLFGTQAPASFGGQKLRSTELVKAVAAQLAVEFKKMYRNGALELQEQLKAQRERDRKLKQGNGSSLSEPLQSDKNTEGVVEPLNPEQQQESTQQQQRQKKTADDLDLEIHHNWSAVENFVRFSKLTGSPRRFIPISRREDGFVTFSERELLVFFCDQSLLANKIRNLPRMSFRMVPGYLIRIFLSDLNTDGLTSRQKGKAGYRGAIKSWSLNRIKDYLRDLAQGIVKPKDHTTKGYLLQGSIHSDGLEIQLVAFKMKELQSARFKRVPGDWLPNDRLTSIVSGVDYFLTGIRNVVKTKEVVMRFWPQEGCDPEQVESQEDWSTAGCALGSDKKGKMKYPDQNTKGKIKAVSTSTAPSSAASSEDASVVEYLKELECIQDRLDDFYNRDHMRLKRHGWDASRRARKSSGPLLIAFLG